MSENSIDPVEILREIYPTLDDSGKTKITAAVDAIKAERDEFKQALEAKPLAEAPTSATMKIVDPQINLEIWYTTRAHTDSELILRLFNLKQKLLESGYIALDTYVDQRRNERANQPTASSQPPRPPAATNGTPPPVAAKASNGDDGTFKAEKLAANINEGNVYWKVKGGKYSRWGVTVWPEVLSKAGFFVDDLNPMEEYDLSGYTAVFVNNDKGSPYKVTELRK